MLQKLGTFFLVPFLDCAHIPLMDFKSILHIIYSIPSLTGSKLIFLRFHSPLLLNCRSRFIFSESILSGLSKNHLANLVPGNVPPWQFVEGLAHGK